MATQGRRLIPYDNALHSHKAIFFPGGSMVGFSHWSRTIILSFRFTESFNNASLCEMTTTCRLFAETSHTCSLLRVPLLGGSTCRAHLQKVISLDLLMQLVTFSMFAYFAFDILCGRIVRDRLHYNDDIFCAAGTYPACVYFGDNSLCIYFNSVRCNHTCMSHSSAVFICSRHRWILRSSCEIAAPLV